MSSSVLGHPLVVAADRFATDAHAAIGQLEKFTGLPYHEHTRAVARVVATYVDRPETVAAAHLHDVIEDIKIPKLILANRFGVVVAELVDEVSNKATPEMGNRLARSAFEVRRLAGISEDGKSIKCGDIAVTMSSIVERSPKFASTYAPEKRSALISLVGAHPQLLELAHETVAYAERELRGLFGRQARF